MWTPEIRTIFLMLSLIHAFLNRTIFAFRKTRNTKDGSAIRAVRQPFRFWEVLSITGITIGKTSEPGKGGRFEIPVPTVLWHFTRNCV